MAVRRLSSTYEHSHYAESFEALFDRAEEYAAWLEQVSAFQRTLPDMHEAPARREADTLRRAFDAIVKIDFFPSDPGARAATALSDIEYALNARFSPDEPTASNDRIRLRALSDYQGRHWATRKNLWVDRVASAWLIRRFIDNHASFVWLEAPSALPADVVGFDFDGAEFTHVETFVTFEVLLRSFGLDADPALHKVGTLVRYLDIGGAPVAEAAGLLTLLAGAKEAEPGDDAFFESARSLFDHLYAAFHVEATHGATQS